ncbi:hypothetical protein VTK73DRAFT_7015 [Phialemonium thermophilum]|uniref:DUF7598 domain-containing protein n=1 Tax=Phialemonium thermophilum TaxID=223376 RepID=A0ABR3XTV4_9PEZI
MFSLGARPNIRGFGHIFLQVLRPLTMIGLLSVMASSWAMVVMSGLTGHFSFFEAMTHVFSSIIALCLFVSELDMVRAIGNYFSRNWPALSPSHSLAWLGLAMVMLGCQLLGDQNNDAYSQKNLGMSVWRLLLASGILSVTFGFVNILSSIIFRDGANGITCRQIRSDGNLAQPPVAKDAYFDAKSLRSTSLRRKDEEQVSAARRLTRVLNPKNFRKSKIQISKPIIHDQDRDIEQGNSGYGDRSSPIVPTVQRPPTALHPAYTGGSRYSEAHMSRF